MNHLPEIPFFTAEEIHDVIGGSVASIYSAITTLVEAGILRALTDRKRNQIWCATAIVEELEDLAVRISNQTHRSLAWQEIESEVTSQLGAGKSNAG